MSTAVYLQSTLPTPKTKKSPKPSAIPTQSHYRQSPDDVDENLLILLHGLGDTHAPFIKLGRSLNLPQTATLSLCGPSQVPFLDDESFQWYPSFTPLGELIPNPNPTPALTLLSHILSHLTSECAWIPSKIHFFGFGQGGSLALEFVLDLWKTKKTAVGSVTSVSGPLLSYPTAMSERCPTPVMLFHRPPPSEEALPRGSVEAIRKGFVNIKEVRMGGKGMPKSKGEWEAIMEFWSARLSRRPPEVEGESLFEVVSGRPQGL